MTMFCSTDLYRILTLNVIYIYIYIYIYISLLLCKFIHVFRTTSLYCVFVVLFGVLVVVCAYHYSRLTF
jgi:hypothetical protein